MKQTKKQLNNSRSLLFDVAMKIFSSLFLSALFLEISAAQSWQTDCGRSSSEDVKCWTSKGNATLLGINGELQSFHFPSGEIRQIFRVGHDIRCANPGKGIMRARVGKGQWEPVCFEHPGENKYVVRLMSGQVFLWTNLSDY